MACFGPKGAATPSAPAQGSATPPAPAKASPATPKAAASSRPAAEAPQAAPPARPPVEAPQMTPALRYDAGALMPIPGVGPPPQIPGKLTQGIPTPDDIARQKEGYARGIDMQFQQGSELLNTQHKQTTEWLHDHAEQRKQQYILYVDQQLKQEELQLSQKFNEQLMQLHQAAQQQRAELEQQANNLALEFHTKKTQEEFAEQQYAVQKAQYDSQLKLMQELQGLGVQSPMSAQSPMPFSPRIPGPSPLGPPLLAPMSPLPTPWGGASPMHGSLSMAPGPPIGLPPLGAMSPARPGFATAALDTNGDGRPNIMLTGADRANDGIPDAMGMSRSAHAPPGMSGFNAPPPAHLAMSPPRPAGIYQPSPSLSVQPGLATSSWTPQVPTSWAPQPTQIMSPRPTPHGVTPATSSAVLHPSQAPPAASPLGSTVLHSAHAPPVAAPMGPQGSPLTPVLTPTPGAAPTGIAMAGLDTNRDGNTNIWYVGADRRGDGVPDALEGTSPRGPVQTSVVGNVAYESQLFPRGSPPVSVLTPSLSPLAPPSVSQSPMHSPHPPVAVPRITTMDRMSGTIEASTWRQTSVTEQAPNGIATADEIPTRCVCGNIFMADAIYCRHCGRQRPQTRAVACNSCGNVYLADAEFCRHCGKRRQK